MPHTYCINLSMDILSYISSFTTVHGDIHETILQNNQVINRLMMSVNDKQLYELLLTMCRHGRLDYVKMAIEYGAPFRKQLKRDRHPMHVACGYGQSNVVEFLLNKNINPNKIDSSGLTPISIACIFGHDSCVDLLVSRVSKNSLNKHGFAPLHYACLNGHVSTCMLLLKRGANIHITTDESGLLHLLCASENPTNVSMMKLLLEQKIDVNAQDKFGKTALHHACKNKKSEYFAELMSVTGVDINATDIYNMTPLHVACCYGFVEGVEMLLNRGAKTDVKDLDGCCAREFAGGECGKFFV